MRRVMRRLSLFLLLLAACGSDASSGDVNLRNVSYDPTRELYEEYNKAFAEHYEKEKGVSVSIEMSHGGSGKQARQVVDGLDADVVTLALAGDIDTLVSKDLLAADWQKKLPNNSSPYTSTIVFLVRGGNPKGIADWGDLIKGDIKIVTPNPKTSGAARWAYLAAWGWAQKNGQDPKAFIAALYKRVRVLDTGARGSTTTFVKNGIGDVLLAWENEAFLTVAESGSGKYEVVYPPTSILAEPPVAVVDTYAAKHGTAEVAKAYLEYLYSEEGQRIIARNGYRPANPELVGAEDLARFPKIELFKLTDVAPNWADAQKFHFSDGGTFDQVYANK
jgi:sulfate/thiosulfate transport system substrate-binding protein